MQSLVFSIYVASGISIFSLLFTLANRKKFPLPPGPKGLPLIGSFFEFPREYPWFAFAKYKEIYGPISSVSVLGQRYVIINDREMAFELLDKRSSIYSDRPNWVFSRMAGMDNILPLMRYGPAHKTQRKAIQQSFGSKNSIARLFPLVEDETQRFLARILTDSDDIERQLRTYAGAMVLKTSYGYSIETNQPDPLIQEAEATVDLLLPVVRPFAWLVDFIPALEHMPDWMPGSEFKQIARISRKGVSDFAERPYRFVKHQMAAGTAKPSFIASLLEKTPHHEDESTIMWAGASMFAGGSDTVLGTLRSFFLAMVLYPTVQKKAQAEIDTVIGSGRLPTLTDYDNLPYVRAVFKEAFRWHSIIPMGLPHVVTKDDIYGGYLIPKGSIVLPNVWMINHDPDNHRDPSEFKPERFLDVDNFAPEIDPGETIFGFGRRVCAGKRIAEASVFVAIAMSLAVLNFNKARDASGAEVTPTYESTNTMISHPKSFECSVTARSLTAKELVMTTDPEHESELSDAQILRGISLQEHEDIY